MDAPPIQYCRTSDGVSIAYYTVGNGPPLVVLPIGSFVEHDWKTPELRSLYERLAASHRLIRFDSRGTGASDRDADTFDVSLDAMSLDFDAVITASAEQSVSILTQHVWGSAATVYARRNADRVARIVLFESYARYADYAATPGLLALRDIYLTDFQMWHVALAQRMCGWSAGEGARHLAELMSASQSQGTTRRFYDIVAELDIVADLQKLQTPTLVLRRRDSHFGNPESSRTLATAIPNARLVVLDGDASWIAAGDQDALVNTLQEFLTEDQDAGADTERTPSPTPFRTILFTDVEESTMLTDLLGDDRARAVMRTHEQITRDALAAHGGTEVKAMATAS